MNDPITLNQLAQVLRLSRSWLKEEAQAGRLPCLRVGRKPLFNLATVKRVLAEKAANGQGALTDAS